MQISLLIQTRTLFHWRKRYYELWTLCILVKNVLMLDLFHLLSSPDVNWWTGVVWIIVMFLSAVWTLILTAPIHCRASIAETLMQRHISTILISYKKQSVIVHWSGHQLSVSVSSGRSRESSLHQLITSTYRNTTPIAAFLYKLYPVLISSFSRLLRSKSPSSIPNSSFRSQDLAFWYSLLNQTLFLNNYTLKYH